MPDFFLRSATPEYMVAAMRGTYEALTGSTLAPDDPTPMQGLSLTGTHWAIVHCGTFYEQTGTTTDAEGNTVPVMTAREGDHAILRWNGSGEIPQVPPGLEIVWRSDAVDPETGEPVPRPEWWSMVIA